MNFKATLSAIFATLVLGASAACADTLTLSQTSGAGALHQYHNVATDAPPTTVTIYVSTQASATNPPPQTIELWFDGFVAGNQFFGAYNNAGNQMVLTNPVTLQTIVVQLTETTAKVCTRSGRGQHCYTVWTLVGGTVIR